jgi:hypothetical protein
MKIQNTAPGDFPVFWKWFRAQDKDTQIAHTKELIDEQDGKEMGLAALAEGHPSLPVKAGPLCKIFLGRTLL